MKLYLERLWEVKLHKRNEEYDLENRHVSKINGDNRRWYFWKIKNIGKHAFVSIFVLFLYTHILILEFVLNIEKECTFLLVKNQYKKNESLNFDILLSKLNNWNIRNIENKISDVRALVSFQIETRDEM